MGGGPAGPPFFVAPAALKVGAGAGAPR